MNTNESKHCLVFPTPTSENVLQERGALELTKGFLYCKGLCPNDFEVSIVEKRLSTTQPAMTFILVYTPQKEVLERIAGELWRIFRNNHFTDYRYFIIEPDYADFFWACLDDETIRKSLSINQDLSVLLKIGALARLYDTKNRTNTSQE